MTLILFIYLIKAITKLLIYFFILFILQNYYLSFYSIISEFTWNLFLVRIIKKVL